MKNVVIHQNLYFKKGKSECKIIIPAIVLNMFINNLHFCDRYLHLNDRNIFKFISKDSYYPKLFLYIREINGKCNICMLASKPILRRTPYKSFNYPSKPRVSWRIDLTGSLGSKLLFIAVCDFSLYVIVKTYESKTEENFIDLWKIVFLYHLVFHALSVLIPSHLCNQKKSPIT